MVESSSLRLSGIMCDVRNVRGLQVKTLMQTLSRRLLIIRTPRSRYEKAEKAQ